jgi:hypothetical protein
MKSFILKDVVMDQVDYKYGLVADHPAQRIPEHTTPLDEIVPPPHHGVDLSFLDPSKQHYLSMIDLQTHRPVHGYHCFWCRNVFTTSPIGCPIRYQPRQWLRKCKSEVTHETYTLQQSVPEHVSVEGYDGVDVPQRKVFLTEGVFCSFNCCLAYIQDHRGQIRYRHSAVYLHRMHRHVFGSDVPPIQPAPSWTLLKEYGGTMTIQEFRNTLGTYTYTVQPHEFTSTWSQVPIGTVFEETYLF